MTSLSRDHCQCTSSSRSLLAVRERSSLLPLRCSQCGETPQDMPSFTCLVPSNSADLLLLAPRILNGEHVDHQPCSSPYSLVLPPLNEQPHLRIRISPDHPVLSASAAQPAATSSPFPHPTTSGASLSFPPERVPPISKSLMSEASGSSSSPPSSPPSYLVMVRNTLAS